MPTPEASAPAAAAPLRAPPGEPGLSPAGTLPSTLFAVSCSAAFVVSVPLSWGHRELAAFRTFELVITVALFLWLLHSRALFRPGSLARGPSRRVKALFWGSGLFYLVLATLSRYASFDVNGVDFSIFDWMLENTLRGRFMYSPIYAVNHFGVHPSYVMLPLVAVHAVLRSPLMLLCAGAVLVWAAGIPMWQLAMALTGEEGIALFAVVALWANPWTAPLILDGFRIESFYPLGGLLLVSGWVRRRDWAFWTGAVLLLTTKEDAALYLTGFVLGGLLTRDERRRKLLGLLVLALSVLVVDVRVVQPLAAGGGAAPGYLKFWSGYGTSFGEILSSMLRRPWRVAWDVATSAWYRLFGPALLLPLLEPRSLAVAAPGIVMLGMAAYPMMRGYRSYYPLPLAVFALWGILAFMGGGNSRRIAIRRGLCCTALLLFPIVGGGYIVTPRPHWDGLRGLRAARTHLEGFRGPVCAQGALFPHLGYALALHPLDEGCLGRPDAVAVLGMNENPWPFDRRVLSALVARTPEQQRVELPGGVVLLESRRGLLHR